MWYLYKLRENYAKLLYDYYVTFISYYLFFVFLKIFFFYLRDFYREVYNYACILEMPIRFIEQTLNQL